MNDATQNDHYDQTLRNALIQKLQSNQIPQNLDATPAEE